MDKKIYVSNKLLEDIKFLHLLKFFIRVSTLYQIKSIFLANPKKHVILADRIHSILG